MTQDMKPSEKFFSDSDPSTIKDGNDIEDKPEKKTLTSRQKIAIAMAGIALSAGLVGGITANILSTNHPTAIEAPVKGGEEEQSIPAEAKAWVGEFGDRYKDPVSTYYSELGYEAKYKTTLLMADEFIDKYDLEGNVIGEKSFLGFNTLSLPLNIKFDQANSIKMFNEYEAPNLNRYLNLIAKNPDAKAVAIIDREFQYYCTGASVNRNGNTSNEKANIRARKMLDTMNAVVEKYGSNAVYTIAPAASLKYQKNDMTTTYFDSDTPTMKWGNDKAFSDNNLAILINIDVYDGKEFKTSREIINDVQITVERMPFAKADTSSFISFGQE